MGKKPKIAIKIIAKKFKALSVFLKKNFLIKYENKITKTNKLVMFRNGAKIFDI